MKLRFLSLTLVFSLFLTACGSDKDEGYTVNWIDNSTDGVNTQASVLGFDICYNDLSRYHQDLYVEWKEELNALFPGEEAFIVGDHCVLTDGTQMLSAVMNTNDQTVIMLDEEGAVLNRLEDFTCPSLGETSVPKLEWLEAGTLEFSCSGGDAGMMVEGHYTLDIESFEYTVVRETSK